MSEGNIGSLIMDSFSLLFMSGILVYTAMYRQRGRMDDRLFYAMTLVNVVLAVSDGTAYLLEGRDLPALWETLTALNIIFFAAFEIFAYLFLLYIDYRAYRKEERILKQMIPYAFPWLFLCLILLVNLKTRWIFYFDAENMYQSGPFYNLVFLPALFYSVVCLIKLARIDRRLILLGAAAVLARVALGIWFRSISSTAFIYTVLLACTHIRVMNHPLSEVKP